jgi:hypothetical protein
MRLELLEKELCALIESYRVHWVSAERERCAGIATTHQCRHDNCRCKAEIAAEIRQGPNA